MAVPARRRDVRRTDKGTGPNLPADTDIDDVDTDAEEESEVQNEDQTPEDDDSAGEQDERGGRREAKYRKQRNALRAELRQVRQELATLKANEKEGGKADRRSRRAQEELAFVKAAAAEGIQDVDAAWKLADRTKLTWEDGDGDEPARLVGIEDALDHVLDRFPYVSSSVERGSGRGRTGDGGDDDDEDDDRVEPPPIGHL